MSAHFGAVVVPVSEVDPVASLDEGEEDAEVDVAVAGVGGGLPNSDTTLHYPRQPSS